MKAPQIENTVVNHTEHFFQFVGAISKYWSGRENTWCLSVNPWTMHFLISTIGSDLYISFAISVLCIYLAITLITP